MQTPVNPYVYRLFDFNVYNEKVDHDGSSGSCSGSEDERRTGGEDERRTGGKNKDPSVFQIQMFGVNEKGETCCIFADQFKPFFYVKVDDSFTIELKHAFLKHIQEKIGNYYGESIVECKLIKRKKLYGFDGGREHKFIYFQFNNLTAFNKVKNLWYDSKRNLLKTGYKFKNNHATFLYEANIPPLLRFFHIRDISPSGWVSVAKNKTRLHHDKKTTCDVEFSTEYTNIVPLNDKETRVPFKICSFDIEASSSHGDFPVPVKTYKKLASQIMEYFESFVLKDANQLQMNPPSVLQLLRDMVLTSFQYEKNKNDESRELKHYIDTVYPIQKPENKKQVESWIDTWLAKAFSTEESEDPMNEIREMVKIETLFEKMNAGGEDEEGFEYGSTNTNSINAGKKTIAEWMMDKTATRDQKLACLNKSLNEIFPKLEGDKVTFIGSTFMRYGEEVPFLNHCIALNTCAPLPVAHSHLESYATEKQVLMAWQKLIQRENPDIIIGYNIFGFDYQFLFQRAQENGCSREFLKLSRNVDEICWNQDHETGKYKIEESSIQIASGQHDLKFIKMTGRLQIDLYNFFRREENLTSYKLDFVAGHFIGDYVKKWESSVQSTMRTKIVSGNLTGLFEGSFIHLEEIGHSVDYYDGGAKFKVTMVNQINGEFEIEGNVLPDNTKKVRWCLAKDDVSPKDIFRMTNGTDEDRAIIAKYCLQDCNLVHYLLNKVDVITGYIEMAKICSVPMNFLVMRGQGIKLTSYIAKKCREKGVLMPVIEKGNMDEGYEGAIVLDPKCDLYLDNPVACVDYASLYPSSMISENLSHDSKVWTQEFDLDGRLIKETGEKDEDGNFIYDNLPGYEYVNITYDTYKYVRKSAKAAAEKVISGKKTCRFAQFPEGKAIMPSILEELLQARKATRKLIPSQTDEFMKNVLDKRQLGYKVTANSLYGQCGAKTSTFYEKDIAACTTATGRLLLTYAKKVIEECYGDSICQTEKHGPVLTKAEYIYGDSVASYTPVLTSTMVNGQRRVDWVSIETLAEKYGNGMWKEYHHTDGISLKEVCEINPLNPLYSWTETGWTRIEHIIRHKLAPHKKMIRILTETAVVDVTDDHSLLRSNGDMVSPKDVSVGTELLHKDCPVDMRDCPWLESVPYCKKTYSLDMRKEYFYKYMVSVSEMDNIKREKEHFVCHFYPHENELAAEIVFTAQQVFGFCVKIDLIQKKRKRDGFYYDMKKVVVSFDSEESDQRIIKMKELDCSSDDGNNIYVYDLTTENHHFAAGIGNLIVHNTDSVFFTFNLHTPEGKPIRGKEALEITIELAQEAGHLASSFLKAPHDLEYEKTFMPFCLLSKKRYVGMLYETDPNKGKRKEMGIVLKRRDNAPIVKDIYGGIIDILMKEQNIVKAMEFLKSCLKNIVSEVYPVDKLIITKSLRSHYKNPQSIAHKVLADRITARDPGNKPGPGDRIPFVYVHNTNKKALQGEKIETPAFIAENQLKIDYSFYITNQIMKPVQQVFALVIEKIWEIQKKHQKLSKFRKEAELLKRSTPPDKWEDKWEQMKNKEVKELLFDEFLRETNNVKTGNQSLTKFFTKKI
jgi:DNA polymerase elongation subunit (family B)